MSPNRVKILAALVERGFTGNVKEFELFYWPKDGWYLHCDQAHHAWIGFNTRYALEEIENGILDHFLETEEE